MPPGDMRASRAQVAGARRKAHGGFLATALCDTVYLADFVDGLAVIQVEFGREGVIPAALLPPVPEPGKGPSDQEEIGEVLPKLGEVRRVVAGLLPITVQHRMSGGQFGFVWLPARARGPRGARVVSQTKLSKIPPE